MNNLHVQVQWIITTIVQSWKTFIEGIDLFKLAFN